MSWCRVQLVTMVLQRTALMRLGVHLSRLLSNNAHLPPLTAVSGVKSPVSSALLPRLVPRPYCGLGTRLLQPVCSLHGSLPSMAGHSKWAKIRRKKAVADLEKAKAVSRLTSQIGTAVRLGGGPDPERNLRLAGIISHAKSEGVPKSTIESAIQSGLRQSGDGAEPVLFEGRGAQGYMLLIEVLTNKTARTRPEIRTIVEKYGGVLGEPGSASFAFEHKGVVQIPREELERLPSCSDPMELAIEVGAEDVVHVHEEELVALKCDSNDMRAIVEAVQERGLTVSSATLEYLPKNLVSLTPESCESAERFVEVLSRHSDVVEVYSNFVLEETM